MNSQNFGAQERMFLKKKVKREFPFLIRGRAFVKKYDKEGNFKGQTPEVLNTITSAGLQEFIRLIIGTSSLHFNSTDASVRINNNVDGSAATEVFQQVGTDSGPGVGTNTKSSPRYTSTWEWHDISANTYSNANYLHFWYGDPDGVSDEYRFATVQINAGNKPNDENWIYVFNLELYSTDTDFTDSGLQHLMLLFEGSSALHLTSSGIRLHPTTGAGSGSEIGSALTPDGNPTNGGTNATWVWTVADGVSEGTWAGTKIKIGTSFAVNLRWGGCKTDGTSCGTKGSGEEWEYTYVFTIAQGS